MKSRPSVKTKRMSEHTSPVRVSLDVERNIVWTRAVPSISRHSITSTIAQGSLESRLYSIGGRQHLLQPENARAGALLSPHVTSQNSGSMATTGVADTHRAKVRMLPIMHQRAWYIFERRHDLLQTNATRVTPLCNTFPQVPLSCTPIHTGAAQHILLRCYTHVPCPFHSAQCCQWALQTPLATVGVTG